MNQFLKCEPQSHISPDEKWVFKGEALISETQIFML